MTSHHSKGKWTAHRHGPRGPVKVETRDMVVAEFTIAKSPEEQWANATLSAAAPDLLALAEKVASLNPNVAEIGAGMLAQLHMMATEAITKATQP